MGGQTPADTETPPEQQTVGGIDIRSIRMPLLLLITILVPIISGTIASITAAYSMRDQLQKDQTVAIQQLELEITQDHLSRYVTNEKFLDWRREDQASRDRQYYQLLNAIQRLEDKVGR